MSADDPRATNGECGGNAAPYVLGALTPAEHEAFAEHLSSCAVCREEVASLQTVAASLPATAPQLAAPRQLKRRVMAEVHEDGRMRASGQSSRSHRRARLRWSPALAPAAVGLAAAVAAVVVIAGSGSGESTRIIRAQVSPPGASASVLTSGGRAQISLAGMPPTRAGRVYEVWIERSGPPAPTDALFTVTSGGDATVAVPGSVDGVKELLVTSEPLGGSKVPTSSPVIVAKLS